jgi:hypothetical protein
MRKKATELRAHMYHRSPIFLLSFGSAEYVPRNPSRGSHRGPARSFIGIKVTRDDVQRRMFLATKMRHRSAACHPKARRPSVSLLVAGTTSRGDEQWRGSFRECLRPLSS